MKLTSRLTLRVAAVGLAVGAVAVPLSTSAHAATTPALTATPGTSLVNGQTISVTGAGFAPNSNATMLECSGLNGQQDCDLTNIVTAPTDATGNIAATPFKVKAGAVGDGTCPSASSEGGCFLVATTDPGDPTDTAAVGVGALDFAPVITVTPNTNVKSGDVLTVAGFGFPHKAQTAYVVECSSASQAGCDGTTVQMPTTTSSGTFSNVKITVHSGAVGDKNCNAGDTCLITATTDISGTIPDTSTAAPFTFAKTQPASKDKTVIAAAAKAKGKKVTVSGSISTAGNGVKGLAVVVYERAKGSHKWHKVGKATSHNGGKFAAKGLKHFGHAEQYQVKHAKQTVKGTVYLASKSSVTTVK